MSNAPNGSERRAAERLQPRGALVNYQKLDFFSRLFSKKKTMGPFPVRNMGSGGVNFLCQENLKPGQRLLMTVRLSDKGPTIAVEAVVVWTGEGKGNFKFQSAVRYVDFKGDAWKILSHLNDFIVRKEETSAYRLHSRKGGPAKEEDAGGQENNNKRS